MNSIVIFIFFMLNIFASADTVTISGISSGGFMAVQMATLYPEQISGVGSVAGGFYFCAGNSYFNSQSCMKNPKNAKLPSIDVVLKNSQQKSYLSWQNQRAYIYQGTADAVVNIDMLAQLEKYYVDILKFDVSHVKKVTGTGNHNFPTNNDHLMSCDQLKNPYIADCDFDLAGDMLSFLIGHQLSIAPPKDENLFIVDQNLDRKNIVNETLVYTPASSLAGYGYLYASDFCLSNPQQCHLHVALHGCDMNDYVSLSLKKFVLQSGFLNYAEKNQMMILFPQTNISLFNNPYNPKRCWDWFGSTGLRYATRDGVEPLWLHQFIKLIKTNPQKMIIQMQK